MTTVSRQSSRTLEWLAQGSGEPAELIRLLSREHVAIVVGKGAGREPQAQLLLSLVANMAARLYPVVQRLSIVVPGDVGLSATVPRWRAPLLSGHLECLLKALAPPIVWDISDRLPREATLALALGHFGDTLSCPVVFAGSQGWTAYLSMSTAQDVSGGPNPVGAYAAACIAVAEIWKRILAPHRDSFPGIPIIPRDEPLMFSALTYSQSDLKDVPLPQQTELGRLTVVGSGAGGGAALYTLASLPHLAGLIHVIDPDEIEDTNLNRYVFADAQDAAEERSKAYLAKQLFEGHDAVNVDPLSEAFGLATSKLKAQDFRNVLAAVHSREARREIQKETPGVLWDCAAGEHGEFRVWRLILGQTECMYCKHPLRESDAEVMKAHQLEALLGLDQATWRQKIRDHDPFTKDEVTRINAHLRNSMQTFELPREGQRFGDWEAAQCGRLSLPELDEGVPIPFAPVMAGVLVAGEILKQCIAPEYSLDSMYENTLLGAFSKHRRPVRRLPSPDCHLCHDPIYIKQYERRITRARY